MMRKCMKKLLALSLVMAALLLVFTPVMAEGDREDLYQPIKEFIDIRYDAIAKVKATSGSFRTMETKSVSADAKEFLRIETLLLSSEIAALNAVSEDLSYKDYAVNVDYSNPVFSQKGRAEVYASVVCRFHYTQTPDIVSEYGLIYRFDLSKADNGKWEIVGRSYPGIFESGFWENETPSYEKAVERSRVILEAIDDKTVIKEPVNDYTEIYSNNMKGNVTYSSTAKDNAANTAKNYVAPDDPANWTSGSGYTYSYPSGYSQVTLDCTNFVSFCLNYSSGGNIPEDNTGTYKWKRNTYAWYNVDGFYSYFKRSKNNTEKGFYGSTYYSANAYPSSSYLQATEKSDIVQFSSKSSSDWTHTAIVSSKTSSGSVYVCMHDAYEYYAECNLSTFYTNEYTGTARYIRLLKIDGYYS